MVTSRRDYTYTCVRQGGVGRQGNAAGLVVRKKSRNVGGGRGPQARRCNQRFWVGGTSHTREPAAPCSEPTVIYNTAIVGALAGLAEYYGAGPWSGELLEVNQVNYSSYLQQ